MTNATVGKTDGTAQVPVKQETLTVNYLILLSLLVSLPGPLMFFAITPVVLALNKTTDWRKTLLSFVLWYGAVTLVAFINGIPILFGTMAVYTGFTLLLGFLLWLHFSGKIQVRQLFFSVSLYALSLILFSLLARPLFGVDLPSMAVRAMEEMQAGSIVLLEKLNFSPKVIQEITINQELAIEYMEKGFSALLYIFVLAAVFLNAFIIRLFLSHSPKTMKAEMPTSVKRKKNQLFHTTPPPAAGSLESFQLDFHLTWILIITWSGLLFSSLTENRILGPVFLNALLICLACYALQGTFVFISTFQRLKANRLVKGSLLLMLAILFPPLLFLMGISGLGLLDSWFNIRKLKSDGG